MTGLLTNLLLKVTNAALNARGKEALVVLIPMESSLLKPAARLEERSQIADIAAMRASINARQVVHQRIRVNWALAKLERMAARLTP